MDDFHGSVARRHPSWNIQRRTPFSCYRRGNYLKFSRNSAIISCPIALEFTFHWSRSFGAVPVQFQCSLLRQWKIRRAVLGQFAFSII